jgi:hypothetical protein
MWKTKSRAAVRGRGCEQEIERVGAKKMAGAFLLRPFLLRFGCVNYCLAGTLWCFPVSAFSGMVVGSTFT